MIEIKGADLFTKLGIMPEATEMPNGEKRLRLGPNYIYTCDSKGAWQNAHFHGGLIEVYGVDVGWMAFAEEVDGVMSVTIYQAGQVVQSRPGHPHNVYLPDDAAIHTFKIGMPVPNPEKNGADWFQASDEFDAWTKAIPEVELLARLHAQLNPDEAEAAAVAEA